LVAAESDGDRLSRDELLATIVLLLIAGHETTANLIGNGLLALARQPGSIASWRDDPSLDRTAVEELLRHSGPVQMAERISLADVEVGDARIDAGRIVILTVAGANRDPFVFADPDRLDLARNPNPHVAFGAGAHHCLGAPLARAEARIALTTLIRRFRDLTVDTSRPRWRRSFTLRGLERLDVRTR
jgi:cytochrome P450